VTLPNRIDLPGTAEHTWSSWAPLDNLPALDVNTWGDVVVVAAHPDDEVLGAGGTLAMLAAVGARLRLIALTDGEASHPELPPALIARTRIAESARALQALGAVKVDVVRLGLPDADLRSRESEVTALLRVHCSGFDTCLAPWDGDAHADHEAAGRAARRACPNVLTYPIWMWHWARPADALVPWHRACHVPLTADAAARKREAIGKFASQLSYRGDQQPVVPPGIVAHFTRRQEVFFR
jgi:LmbE family N-acetylglucosaminyl deacetylase